ncbi:MAG: FecR domain-containing protein [Deltaproteobacteria bacterium]|nr:FecR domain-containing protein [Deltaproteobacteria bacterium]
MSEPDDAPEEGRVVRLFDPALPELSRGHVETNDELRRDVLLWKSLAIVSLVVLLTVLAMLLLSGSDELLTRSGESLDVLATGETPLVTELSDGTVISLGPESRLSALRTEVGDASFLFERGRVSLDLELGSDTRLTVDAGSMRVEMIGASIELSRTASVTEIFVRKGRVLVRGDEIEGKSTRLTGGSSLRLTHETAPPPKPIITTLPAVVLAEPQPSAPKAPDPPSELEDRIELIERRIERRAATPDESAFERLLISAELERKRGRPAEAASLLEAAIPRAAKPSDAGLAAYSLAHIELMSLGRWKSAATHYERAIALGLPPELDEEAHARRVQCYAKGKDASNASAALGRYRALYPLGRYVDQVGQWLSETE